MESLIVDRREPWKLVDTIHERTSYTATQEHLKTGDIVHEELSASVERKTLNDAVESVGNNRLFEQAERIADEYAHGCVVVAGQEIHPIRAECHNGHAGSVRMVMGATSYINEEYPNVHATWVPGDGEWGMVQLVEYVDRWLNQLDTG